MRWQLRAWRSRAGAVLRALQRDDAAPTTVEYAILLGGIAIAIVVAVGVLGGRVRDLFASAESRWP
ncbi:MAG TPA: Flp family type IVb pilin [Anaeromyxobacter sp.]